MPAPMTIVSADSAGVLGVLGPERGPVMRRSHRLREAPRAGRALAQVGVEDHGHGAQEQAPARRDVEAARAERAQPVGGEGLQLAPLGREVLAEARASRLVLQLV